MNHSLPTIRSYFYDSDNDIQYCVIAFSRISKAELALYIPVAISEMKRRERPRSGDLVHLVTATGPSHSIKKRWLAERRRSG